MSPGFAPMPFMARHGVWRAKRRLSNVRAKANRSALRRRSMATVHSGIFSCRNVLYLVRMKAWLRFACER